MCHASVQLKDDMTTTMDTNTAFDMAAGLYCISMIAYRWNVCLLFVYLGVKSV
jgi:hypothetical protein